MADDTEAPPVELASARASTADNLEAPLTDDEIARLRVLVGRPEPLVAVADN